MRRFLAAAAVLLVPAAPAGAASLGALDGDPLDRAATMALPAIYRLESAVAVASLVAADGTAVAIPSHTVVREVGTAFGVARGGRLVAAGHVALPSEGNLAFAALRALDAARGVERTSEEVREEVRERGLRPIGTRRVALVARQADGGAGGGRRYRASVVRIDRRSDLALVRIGDAPGAPVLRLGTSAARGTPVVTIGFGTGVSFTTAAVDDGVVPAVRKGRLGDTFEAGPEGLVPGKRLTRVDTLVRDGDSGAPALDRAGRVRGVILYRDPRRGGGSIMWWREVSRLLMDAGVVPRPGPADPAYRRGLRQLWELDFRAAARSFAAAAKAFPAHTLAGALERRAMDLEEAEFRIAGERRPQAFLMALGIVSAIAALACALALAAPAIGRAYRPDR